MTKSKTSPIEQLPFKIKEKYGIGIIDTDILKDCLCVNKKTGKLEILKNVFIIDGNHYYLVSEIHEK